MADPTFQTLCCRHANLSDNLIYILEEFDTAKYNKFCIFSSFIGILGSVYQILPRRSEFGLNSKTNWTSMSPSRGRQIVVWLAFADLFATLGVLIRSLLWLNRKENEIFQDEQEDIIMCAGTSAWIQYFYMSTWLWNICYAVDMKLVLMERQGLPNFYHLICWLIPAILTTIALIILYVPNANCHQVNNLPEALFRILPNYCATYGPLLVALIACPSIYIVSWKSTRLAVARGLSQLTSRERAVLFTFKIKFALITVALYFCWWPNLITSIVLWFLWEDLPIKFITSLWYIMALTNPLQALLNALVYRRWSSSNEFIYIPCCKLSRKQDESSPLLAPVRNPPVRSCINSGSM